MFRMILLFGALAGCEAAIVAQPSDSSADLCNAASYDTLVGQPRNILDVMRFSGPVRIIGPGDMVTMDHNPARLNIDIDASGRIAKFHCG